MFSPIWLLCAVASAADSVSVTFAWGDGDQAEVALTRRVERRAGDATLRWTTRATSTLKATRDRSQNVLRLAPWTVQEDAWEPADGREPLLALTASLPDAPSAVWIDKDGLLAKIDPAPAVRALAGLAEAAAAAHPDQAEPIRLLTTTGRLFREAQDRWDRLMGQWLGRRWTVGLPKTHQEKAATPPLGGDPLMSRVQLAFDRFEPCHGGAGAPRCAVFTHTSAVDPEALAAWEARLAGSGGVDASVDRYQSTLHLDPEGARPHRLHSVRTSVRYGDAGGPVTLTTERTLVFAYP